jgi:hypothetical protein
LNIPTVDSTVTVTLEFTHGSKTFTGRVLKPYRWLSDRQFTLSGDTEMPVRVIDGRYVTSLVVHSGSSLSVDTGVRVRQVAGSRGAVYTVTHDNRGIRCTCPGFQFRKSCRHLSETV